MTRALLDRSLQHLDRQLVQLGLLVDGALEQSLTVLETGDGDLAQQIIVADHAIDTFRNTIEQQALRLLQMQQPLGVRDIRYLTAVRIIAGRLERMGDGAAGIAKVALSLPFSETSSHKRFCTISIQDEKNTISEDSTVQALYEIGQEVRRLLQQTMQVFIYRDIALARHLTQEDDVVDVRYHMVRHDLMTLLKGGCALEAVRNDENILTRATYLLWIAHKLERAADHCSHICYRTIFLQDGEWKRSSRTIA